MSNKEKLDLLVSMYKQKSKNLQVEEDLKTKWRLLAAQGSVQTRALKQKQNFGSRY